MWLKGGWAFWLNCEFMACFILSNSYLLQISTITHPYLSWQNKKATILWCLYRKTNCHYRDSLPLHLEAGSYRMALMSPSCPATLKKSGFNAFIFCLTCHRVRVLDLLFPNSPVCCEESRLQEQVHHAIRRGLNNWCHAGAISCETVLSEDSLVLESLHGYGLTLAFVLPPLLPLLNILSLGRTGKEGVIFTLAIIQCYCNQSVTNHSLREGTQGRL